MTTPLSTTTTTQVELLCLTEDGPVMFEGRARSSATDGEIEIDLSRPAPEKLVGSQTIITFRDADTPRLTARVLRCEGNRLTLSAPRLRPRDKRLYPRLFGSIALRYQVHQPQDGDLAVHRWLAGSSEDLALRPWRSPEPFMNFSVNGLCFEDEPTCQEGDLLLLHLGVGEDPRRWRATGRVVRVSPAAPAEDQAPEAAPLFEVALSFETLPDEAMEALSDFTLAIQEAML